MEKTYKICGSSDAKLALWKKYISIMVDQLLRRIIKMGLKIKQNLSVIKTEEEFIKPMPH
jgi:hypothetical protein